MNFFGKTLSFPIRPDVRGSLTIASTDEDIIVQSIVDLLETRQGERKMLPNYGLPDVLFDALDATFAPRLAFFIEEQILNYIPAIQSVSAVAGAFDNGNFVPNAIVSTHKAAIRILWTKRGEFVPQELIYPTWRFNSDNSVANTLPFTDNENAPVTDTAPPTVPANLSLSVISTTEINGVFSPSTDNVGVTRYKLRRATNSEFTTNVVDTDLGNETSFSVAGLSASTTYFFKVLAEDAEENQSNWSEVENATTDAPPFSPTDLGADLLVYLDADLMPQNHGETITTIENFGSAGDWSKFAGTVSMAVETGKKAIHVEVGGILESATISALSQWTFYALVKSVTDPTENHYFFRSFKFSGNKAIIAGFVDGKFEYYDDPRTDIGNISTSTYSLIKCTVGTTATGEWRICSDGDYECYVRAVIGLNRHLTSPETAALEAWLAEKAT